MCSDHSGGFQKQVETGPESAFTQTPLLEPQNKSRIYRHHNINSATHITENQVRVTVYLANQMEPYCPRWRHPYRYQWLRSVMSSFKHMQVREQSEKLTCWRLKERKRFSGDIKMFSAPGIQKACRPAAELVHCQSVSCSEEGFSQ